MNLRRLLGAFTIAAGATLLAACGNAPEDQAPGGLDDTSDVSPPAAVTEPPADTAAQVQPEESEPGEAPVTTVTPAAATPANAPAPEPTPSPAETLEFPATDQQIIAAIDAAFDFVELWEVQQAYKEHGEPSEAVDQALKAKWDAITAGMEPKTMIEGLDALDACVRVSGEKEYTFYLLLKTTQKLTTDYHVTLTAKVDPSHLMYIKPDKVGGNYTTWSILLYEQPTSTWAANEFYVVHLKVDTEIIPYNLSAKLHVRGADRKYEAGAGQMIDLGWQADVN